MNPYTGEIFRIQGESVEAARSVVKRAGLVAITDEEEAELLPQTKSQRKNWMRNRPCICQSGKKFKRCCWGKF